MNPFQYGSIVVEKDFCGRSDDIKQLQQHIVGSQNVVVYGERRVGKTSLIFEAIRRKKGYRTVRLDLMSIKSIDALCRKFISAIGEMEQQSGLVEKFIKSIPALRPSVTVDPITGLPSIGIDATVSLSATNLQEIIGLIKKAYQRKKLVVVIDEFQAVLELSDGDAVLAELRAQVQHAPEVPFVFAGSIRHQMETIFSSHDSPFFKSAIPMSIEPLPFEEFSPFLLERFCWGKRKVSDELLRNLFSLSGGVTGDVQQFCEALWYVSAPGDEITQKHVGAAIKVLISREKLSFQTIAAKLTMHQFNVLTALSVAGGQNPTSQRFLELAKTRNASSVTKALDRLEQLRIIYQTHEGWKFMNPVFKLFLQW